MTIARLWQENIGKLLELDLRYPRTAYQMMRRPGWLIREYLEGNRDSWFNPGKFVFLNATFYALVLTFAVPSDRLAAGFSQESTREVIIFAMGVVAYTAFIYLFVAAIVARWLLRPVISTVAEAYVALLYIYGQGLLILSIIGLVYWHIALTRVAMLIYITWVVYQLAAAPRWSAILKGIVIYLSYTLAAMASVWLIAYIRFVLLDPG
ncbi:MAG: hypothetical protein DHS20C11_11570 [Lysobacteraceae bacterium]|nr:MAG: hypothetical protein DHS20C11_11570 [Xanthomonadaceae bacterium]